MQIRITSYNVCYTKLLRSPQGILIGGSKDKLNGILSKKQEIKDLSRRSIELDEKLDKARLDQSTLESEARQLERQLQQLTEGKNNAAKAEIEAEKEQVKATEELKNARRHLEIITLEKEQLQGEASDIDEEVSVITSYSIHYTKLYESAA